MTVTHRTLLACALVLGLILLLIDAVPVAAHAELVSSNPAAGSTLTGSPEEIVAQFDEPLEANSSMELIGPGGARVVTGGVDPTDRTQMVVEPGDLAPGEYEARWTAASADGHVERGTWSFTVVAPTPRPTAAQPATPRATVSPSPTASPTPTGAGNPATGAADVLFPLLAAVIALAALGAFLLRRNRRSTGR